MAPLRPVGAKARRNKLLWLLGVGVLFGLYYHHSIIVAFTSGSAIAPTGCSQDKEDIHHLLADDPGSAADSIQLPPDVPPDLEQRCRGTAGGWCEAFYRQPLVPARPPPQDNQSCLWNCNFVGVCNHRTGICRCPAGWTGDDCSTRQVRPCSQHARVDGSWEPYRAPPNITSELVNMDTACASQCDEDTGHCFCDADTAHGRVPAPLDSLPGSPPLTRGRPMSSRYCQPDRDEQGRTGQFGQQHPDLLWGPEGWCQADSPKYLCPCALDGYCGPTCDTPCEAFCPNQCSGHGECNRGFCKCTEGWWGQDCANRLPSTPWDPGLVEERPWLASAVHVPAAVRGPQPGAARRRPFIYIYELPPRFNSHLLQYRDEKLQCTYRYYDEHNGTIFEDSWGYAAETGLYEALLQSEHRTLDPEEADFYYMPVFSTCYLFIHIASDFPFFHAFHNVLRVHAATNMLIEAQHWVQTHHPYWNRNGGRDHIIFNSYDEGSCWLPAVLRPAILLTHWGRMDLGHMSHSGYWMDNYTESSHHPIYMPEGYPADKLGNYPCYDPKKDLVIPPMESPNKYSRSPLLGNPTRNRTVFAFFRGRTQQENPGYSRGIRQRLENLTRDEDWWGRHRIWAGEGWPPGVEELDDEGGNLYSQVLASSVFCFALPGDGFSPRFEDAMQHGCIPVIIQDEVHLGFESILDFTSFTVRIAERDLANVPQILLAYTAQQIGAMQRSLGGVWRRYTYGSVKRYRESIREVLQQNAAAGGPTRDAAPAKSLPEPEPDYDPGQDDAVATIIAWLHSRVPHTRGPPADGGSPAATGAQQQAAVTRAGQA